MKAHKSPLAKAMKKSTSSTSTSTPGWMRKGAAIEDEIKKNKAEMAANMRPDFWLTDGEVKPVRFCSSDPIAAIYQYSVKVKGKWRRFTQPAPGDADPFAAAGLNPSLVCVYEVIDINGYINKEKKRFKNQRKFWLVGARLNSQIQALRKKFGGLLKYNVEVTRDGEGKNTTYQLIPEQPSPAPIPNPKDLPLSPKFAEYFAPASLSRMEAIVGTPSTEDDDED